MLNLNVKGIVYIDCMSNSGVYKSDDGEEIKGTPLLVSEIIAGCYADIYRQEGVHLFQLMCVKQN